MDQIFFDGFERQMMEHTAELAYGIPMSHQNPTATLAGGYARPRLPRPGLERELELIDAIRRAMPRQATPPYLSREEREVERRAYARARALEEGDGEEERSVELLYCGSDASVLPPSGFVITAPFDGIEGEMGCGRLITNRARATKGRRRFITVLEDPTQPELCYDNTFECDLPPWSEVVGDLEMQGGQTVERCVLRGTCGREECKVKEIACRNWYVCPQAIPGTWHSSSACAHIP